MKWPMKPVLISGFCSFKQRVHNSPWKGHITDPHLPTLKGWKTLVGKEGHTKCSNLGRAGD